MTDTEPTVYPHAITDLSQVRWYVQGEAPDLWIVGDATTKGQRAKAFVLHVARADCNADGGDSSSWLAEQVAVKLSETDEELRYDLGGALGWNLPENPDDERDESSTWAEIIAAVKAMRNARAAVVPDVVAAALGVFAPDHHMDCDGDWTPDRILTMLAEHGLKVVRA